MSRIVTLVLFLVLVVGGGVLIGTATAPGEWYEALAKPAFNPPNWIFAPVWTILYVMIAVAGWRVWTRTHTAGAMAIWWLQLGLNFLWSPVFFTQQAIGPAFVIILALLLSIIAFISVTRRWDRVAALLFVPYAAWVAFAALLNGSILVLN
jgi:benzodiazapine receptor